MTAEPTFTMPLTLPDLWLKRLRLTWPRAILLMFAALLLALAVALWAEGVSPAVFTAAGTWRVLLLSPAEVLYFMAISLVQSRTRLQEALAIRPLVELNDAGFQAMLEADPALNHRRQWLAIGLGCAFGILMRLPGLDPRDGWLNAYAVLTSGMMWAAIGLGAYTGLASPPLVSQAERHGLRLDLFDLSFLQPVARNSLVIVLSFIGGITVPLFFVPLQGLLHPANLLIYAGIVVLAVWIFYQSMRGTHRVLAMAKQRELKYTRGKLAAAYRQLQGGAADSDAARLLTEDLRTWLALEQRLLAVPEWPYDTRTLRSLGVAVLAPILSVVARLVVERLF
jgi:hypothetical protein